MRAPDIPGHRVTGVLGSGGFATVYRGWQLAVGREVAVKVDNRVLITDRDRQRFVREVTAAGRLSGHPHVVDVYDAGTLDDGRPYLVMELCPGGSLQDQLNQYGPMPSAKVRDIGVSLADALAAAHGAGILHRDIKPANVLINRFGVVGLSDFGLASITAGTEIMAATREALTPAYASPEAFRCEEPTVPGDLYSLAATLYALLAGFPPRFPRDGRPAPGIATIAGMQDVPPDDIPGVPPEFMSLLHQTLAADPTARPPTATAFRDALAASSAAGGDPRLADPRTADPRLADPRTADPRLADPRTADPWLADPRTADPWLADPRTAGASTVGEAHPGGRPDRPWRALAAATAAVLAVAVCAFAVIRLLPHSRASASEPTVSSSAPSGSGPVFRSAAFGVPVVARGCPAAAVAGASARCTANPECWEGVTIISGNATAAQVPCAAPHYWQTFAIAVLPADVTTFRQQIVQASPVVSRVCSMRVLLRSRRGSGRLIPAGAWRITVLPPDETAFDSGARAYRCLAAYSDGATPRTSQFARLPQADV